MGRRLGFCASDADGRGGDRGGGRWGEIDFRREERGVGQRATGSGVAVSQTAAALATIVLCCLSSCPVGSFYKA